MTKEYKLVVLTPEQKIIYEKELSGQISDGHWENEDTDERLWNVTVEVFDPSKHNKLGCNFKPKFPLDFNDPDLYWLLDSRTLEYVQEEFPGYTVEDLHADLEHLTVIVFGEH